MASSNDERTPLLKGPEASNETNIQVGEENSPQEGMGFWREFCFKNAVVPLTVGIPYESNDARRYDACMSSVLFCLAIVAMRFVILMGSVINKYFPDNAEDNIQIGWVIMQESPLFWTLLAIMIQVWLLWALRKHRYFQEQNESPRHENVHENRNWVKAGIVVFAIGSMLLYAGKIYDNAYCAKSEKDHKSIHKFYHISEIVEYLISIFFTFLQSIFLLKTSKKHLKIQNRPKPRFAYMYLVGTNITVSMYYFATEVWEAVFISIEHPDYFKRNLIEPDFASCEPLRHTHANEVLWYFFVYLHPLVIEFNFLAVEILCHQWADMGPLEEKRNKQPEETERAKNELDILDSQESMKPTWLSALISKLRRFKDSFFNLDWKMVAVFSISFILTWLSGMLNALHDELPKEPHPTMIYLIYDAVIKVIYTLVILRGFNSFKLVQTERSIKSGFSGTDILLMVSGTCYYFLNLMILVADAATKREGGGTRFGYALVDSTYCFFIWFQTLFIIFIQRRPLPKNEEDIDRLKRVLVCLGAHNIVIWFKMSFIDLNVGRQYTISVDTYGITTFLACLYLFYPIGIFYYFTSARLLADQYHKISKATPSNEELETTSRESQDEQQENDVRNV